MNTGAFLVTLAVGTAALHDCGRRLELPVIASSRLDAASIAERNANVAMLPDDQYAYAIRVRPVRGNHTNFTPPSGLAVAV